MTSHLGYLALYAACVAVVFGTVLRETARDQLRFAARVFGTLVVSAYVLGWVMLGLFG